MVEDRSIYERHKEHVTELGSPHSDEYKYIGMRKTAKPQEWFMLPVIVCSGHIPRRELVRIENNEIQRTPHNWNQRGKHKKFAPVIPTKLSTGRPPDAPPTQPKKMHVDMCGLTTTPRL